MSLYPAPLRRSQRSPSRQARFGVGRCPPFEDRSGSGRSGYNFSHRLAVNSIPTSYSRFFIKYSSLVGAFYRKYHDLRNINQNPEISYETASKLFENTFGK
jgi:hypothetical protein